MQTHTPTNQTVWTHTLSDSHECTELTFRHRQVPLTSSRSRPSPTLCSYAKGLKPTLIQTLPSHTYTYTQYKNLPWHIYAQYRHVCTYRHIAQAHCCTHRSRQTWGTVQTHAFTPTEPLRLINTDRNKHWCTHPFTPTHTLTQHRYTYPSTWSERHKSFTHTHLHHHI